MELNAKSLKGIFSALHKREEKMTEIGKMLEAIFDYGVAQSEIFANGGKPILQKNTDDSMYFSENVDLYYASKYEHEGDLHIHLARSGNATVSIDNKQVTFDFDQLSINDAVAKTLATIYDVDAACWGETVENLMQVLQDDFASGPKNKTAPMPHPTFEKP